MLEWIFKKVRAEEVVGDDLREAEVGLLNAARSREYWQHQEAMYSARISRLSACYEELSVHGRYPAPPAKKDR